jgi:predicted acylesterase/phospholipase RssA
MPNFGKLMTGLQIGGGIMGGLATVSVTKSLLDEAIEIAPYAIGGTVMIGCLIIIVKFA